MSKLNTLCENRRTKLIVGSRDIVSGMDVAEMEESFDGRVEDGYHPFKNGEIELE